LNRPNTISASSPFFFFFPRAIFMLQVVLFFLSLPYSSWPQKKALAVSICPLPVASCAEKDPSSFSFLLSVLPFFPPAATRPNPYSFSTFVVPLLASCCSRMPFAVFFAPSLVLPRHHTDDSSPLICFPLCARIGMKYISDLSTSGFRFALIFSFGESAFFSPFFCTL